MKYPIVILHGWGKDMTGERYAELKAKLEKKGYKVFSPDLPGFGKNSLKKVALQFDDYVSFVHTYIEEILKETKEDKVILIGHSFGGRIAIRFTSLYPGLVKKLILSGASGLPQQHLSVKKMIIQTLTKILRPIFSIPPFSYIYASLRKLVYYSIGEMDYYKAGNLTKTFKNVYQISIKDDLENIHIPTLLIWGELDTFVPLSDGEYMHNHIYRSKLLVVKKGTHRLPYTHPDIFVKNVLDFIK